MQHNQDTRRCANQHTGEPCGTLLLLSLGDQQKIRRNEEAAERAPQPYKSTSVFNSSVMRSTVTGLCKILVLALIVPSLSGCGADFTAPGPERDATSPQFAPEPKDYAEAQNITLTVPTDRARIYYTVDGTEPSADSPVYDAPIPITATSIIQAVAISPDGKKSDVSFGTFIIETASAESNP